MPYNPSQTYQGGSFLSAGLAGLGGGIAKGISGGLEEYQKAKEEQEANQMVIDYAVKNNMISPEDHTKFLEGSKSQKNGIVAGLTRTLAMDMQRQTAEQQRRSAVANANFDVARAASELAEAGGAGQADKVIAEPLVINGRDTGYDYARLGKTMQILPRQTGEVRTATLPGGEQFYFGGARGAEPKQMKSGDPIKQVIADQLRGSAPTTTPSPSPSATTSQPVRVNTLEEAKALRPGTLFIDPQGVVRRR